MDKIEHYTFEEFKKATSETEPFCGRKSLKIETFHKFKFSKPALAASSFCFAFKGRIDNKITVDLVLGKQIRTKSVKLAKIEGGKRHDNWKFECFQISSLLEDHYSEAKIESITISAAGGDLFLDEVILGRSEGFFRRVQSKIGARPSGNFIVQESFHYSYIY